MEENGKKEGVTTTKSGLQYKVVNKGGEEKFDEKKFKNPMFKVKYKGTLLDGTVFDDTKGKSVELPLQVIPGFAEALTTMPVGSKWIVYIPSELAYGENTPGAPIEPNSPLIFDLELDGISEAPAPQGGPMSISPEQLQEMLKQSAPSSNKVRFPSQAVPVRGRPFCFCRYRLHQEGEWSIWEFIILLLL